jgi:hypothetical protein
LAPRRRAGFCAIVCRTESRFFVWLRPGAERLFRAEEFLLPAPFRPEEPVLVGVILSLLFWIE